MHPVPTQHATLASAHGSCPNCGEDVPRTRLRAGGVAREIYNCASCGVFTYSNRGPRLPVVVPVR
ncbi:MAG: hypothetical protein R3185_07250 [Candidatus Thermoplasmatota archaeon]|nr:hypothetical protein [Candidatus Thermoplasmatota archaeon]